MAESTVYKMKGIAMGMIQGGHDDLYSKFIDYCYLLKERNLESVAFCTWKVLQQPEKPLQFKSIFISFASKFRGLVQGCRGLVGVDGFHLKGNYEGVLLFVVSIDANNEIFLVVAMVDLENKSSWCWFFHHLKTIITETGREDWTIMSDRQKGIDPSLDRVWPKVPMRYCARHLCKNFKSEYPVMLMHKVFWSVTNVFAEFSFRKAITKLHALVGLGAVKWFKEIGPLVRWTNGGVRRIAMVRHATRQQRSEERVEGLCPNIRERVRDLIKESRSCHAYPAGRGEHGMRALLHAGKEPTDYVNEWYSVARYKATYNGNILPLLDKEQWPKLDNPKLLPPPIKRSVGRPSRNRRRE
ncbi:uncharacterized protein LOC110713491 [Chenopodium quinoa]|uniref:uncharacterized protein LOC110713491 n=1 Tax=Chenopodium quinoa TaxID=63459 RepID=UPI000B775EDD|nr:uncharacterized protein LOC110713491 [Chenopodium quinoa]